MIQSVAAITLMFFEILAAELVFLPFLERRRKFPFLLAACILVCMEVILMVSLLYGYGTPAVGLGDSLFKIVYYLLIFFLTFLCF